MTVAFISMHKARFGMNIPFLFHRDLCPEPFDPGRREVWYI
jgi:hypothetical protein